MKLLLTSAGITNPSLAKALKSLVKEPITIAFIPTATNVEVGDKDWLISDLVNARKLGTVDLVDISALEKDQWLPRLQAANIIIVGGGNSIHLMKWIVKSGLDNEFQELLKTRVYVGISAGSCITSKNLDSSSRFLYEENVGSMKGLGLVNFYVRPHLNSPHFPKVKDECLKQDTHKLDQDVYALDDDSGILVVDGKIEVISEGKWIFYNWKEK